MVVKNVYELKRKPGEENEDPQCREVTRCSVAFTIPITLLQAKHPGYLPTGAELEPAKGDGGVKRNKSSQVKQPRDRDRELRNASTECGCCPLLELRR